MTHSQAVRDFDLKTGMTENQRHRARVTLEPCVFG